MMTETMALQNITSHLTNVESIKSLGLVWLDDPTSSDDDYISEGDATVEKSCGQLSRL